MKSFLIVVLVLLSATAVLMTNGTSADAKTIKFSGYDWEIRPSAKAASPARPTGKRTTSRWTATAACT